MRGSINLRISRSLSQLLYLISQFHRTNPELRDDYWDSSGMTFYYTPNLRPHDAGMLITGEMHLLLPPMQEKYVFSNMHVFEGWGGSCKNMFCISSLLHNDTIIVNLCFVPKFRLFILYIFQNHCRKPVFLKVY